MKWGVYLSTSNPPQYTQQDVLRATGEFAEVAESLGYDSVWVLEHHFTRYGLCGTPLALAAFLLGRTRRLRVGTAISVVPLDHPLRLAETVALLDQMSEGRLYFGVGRGSFTKDFKVFGADMSRSQEMMDEWVEIMLSAWTTGRAAANGPFVQFPEVEVFPEPFTKPHPPVYVVCGSPTTVEWAAQRGLPMLIHYFLEDEQKIAQMELYAEVAAAAGHDPGPIDHALSCLAYVDDDTEHARAQTTPYLTWWIKTGQDASALFAAENKGLRNYSFHQRRWEELVLRDQWRTEQILERAFRLNPVGSPEHCIGALRHALAITGIRHVICGFESPGERTLVLDSMQRFMEEVAPHVVAARPEQAEPEAEA